MYVREILQRTKRALSALLARRDPAEYFVALTLIGLLAFALRMLIGGEAAFLAMFFRSGEDHRHTRKFAAPGRWCSNCCQGR